MIVEGKSKRETLRERSYTQMNARNFTVNAYARLRGNRRKRRKACPRTNIGIVVQLTRKNVISEIMTFVSLYNIRTRRKRRNTARYI